MANYKILHQDCRDWLYACAPNSIHAVCTDPPYGLIEFSEKEVSKLRNGNKGGIWRIPPSIGGHRRDPLPRFTILTEQQKQNLFEYIYEFGKALYPALVPGAHVCVAGHPMLQYLVQNGMASVGYEVRPALLRLYTSFRGGDRPKGAEQDFPEVCVTPRSAYEPWMLFRKPISERTVADNLRQWKTGGLRRLSVDKPLPEAIPSTRTPTIETEIADHPCLKPQQFMRIIVRSLLPLGEGILLDPFMGAGSTIASAEAVGYQSLGIEIDQHYYEAALESIPRLANLYPDFRGDSLDWTPEVTGRKAATLKESNQVTQGSLPL
jgi:site-specific DNA-methyltransferase (adenine-specific)